MRIDYQNEYLLAWNSGELLAATPDVIASRLQSVRSSRRAIVHGTRIAQRHACLAAYESGPLRLALTALSSSAGKV